MLLAHCCPVIYELVSREEDSQVAVLVALVCKKGVMDRKVNLGSYHTPARGNSS